MWFAIVGKRWLHEHDRAHPVADGEAFALEEQRLVLAGARSADEVGARPRLLVLDEADVRHLAAALGVERRLMELRAEAAAPRPTPAPRSP